jgi:hypothetical protein
VEELRKTKKRLPIILELLAKMSCQLLDSNPIVVCTEPPVAFESVVITGKLLTDSILYADPNGRAVEGVGPASARMLGLWFRIPPGAWISVFCKCFVLSGAGLCDGPIPRPEESYRVWCVVGCGQVQQ